MRALFLALAAFVLPLSTHAQETKIVELKADKPVYAVGDTALLRANFYARPDNSDFEFDIVGTLNGTPIPADRVTDFQIFSSAKNLAAGSYTWNVQVVIQDARYARDLKDTINYYADLAANLNDQIAVETDPDKLANLTKQRDDALSLKAAAESELSDLRSPVMAPLSLNFSVQCKV